MSPSDHDPIGHADGEPLPGADGLAIGQLPTPGQINLRADPGQLVERLNETDLPLAPQPNAAACLGSWTSLGLGPDEWLLLGPRNEVDDVCRQLTEHLAGCHASIVDVTEQWQMFEIRGRRVVDLLAALSPLDPALLAPGHCAQTLMAKATVVLYAQDGKRACRVLVRSSFARHFHEALRDQAVLLADEGRGASP